MLRICASILPRSIDEARSLIELAETKSVDMLEIRLDRLHIRALATIKASIPLVATCRAQREGGSFLGSEKDRMAILKRAAEFGFQYVDIELGMDEAPALAEEIHKLGCKLIVSHHELEGTPQSEAILEIHRRELKLKPEICKIVTYAHTYEDNLILLDVVSKLSRSSKIVCFGMGEKGRISRIFSPVFGGYFTMAALIKNRATAPGQVTVDELIEAWQILGLA
jgi:3-dehydroquinate dehydratase type I